MKKLNIMECKKFVTYAKKNLVLMKMMKMHLNYTINYTGGKFRGAAHGICNLRSKTPKEIPVVFHNSSTYNYHFIIKQLAIEFDGQLECLGENTEKYTTFSVSIKRELDNSKTITYKISFINGFGFMSTSLSSLADNLSEIYSKRCRNKNYKSACHFIGLKNNRLR